MPKAKRSDSKTKKKAVARKAPKPAAFAATATVATWEDDPGDPNLQPALAPINVPAPNQAAQPLPFKIGGTTPPVKVFQPGTSNFRFYAAAGALRRTADFWGALVPAGTRWQVGARLPVILDDGVDLNAFYTRGEFGDAPGLHFFHDSVGGRSFFSAESPDVACHEMGHALLDAIRPQLFDAQTIEAAAFHEAMGDITAILSALQVSSFRQKVFDETAGVLNRSSRLSRLAEQLGAAIRVHHPDAVESDCLRNAVNSFFYRDPQTLPPAAPASTLSSEPHSFSRVFTGAFLDALAGIFKVLSNPPALNNLVRATQDAGRLLVAGILEAPVVPDYFSQVAAHMISAGERAPFNGKYRDVLKSAFVRRGILSLQAAVTITSVKPDGSRRAALGIGLRRETDLPQASISGAVYGLKQAALKVHTAEEPKRFAVTSSSLMLGPVEPRSAQNAAESFTEDLFQRGRVDVGSHAEGGAVRSLSMKTHVIIEEDGDLALKRRTFECGFD
ncbi:MAG TPA: hypothetical protein VGN86_06260 [Pyrinomonadaceae bacterium]|jgi:hypothetical protein|nr:hypothetical protein [Pyrinomonadaceae bacterium]